MFILYYYLKINNVKLFSYLQVKNFSTRRKPPLIRQTVQLPDATSSNLPTQAHIDFNQNPEEMNQNPEEINQNLEEINPNDKTKQCLEEEKFSVDNGGKTTIIKLTLFPENLMF